MTIFTHRKLVVITGQNISSVECSKLTQFTFLAILTALVGWGFFASYYVVRTEIRLAGALDDGEALKIKYVRLKNDHMHNHKKQQQLSDRNKDLTYKIASLKHTMHDMTGLLDNLSDLTDARSDGVCRRESASTTPRPAPLAILKGDLNEITQPHIAGININTEDVNLSISSLEDNVDQRIAAIRSAINELPATARPRLKKLPKILRNSGNGKGGPYIPEHISESPSRDLALLNVKIRYLTALERSVRTMPLAQPYEEYRVTSGFGGRTDPITGKRSGHFGIDLNAGHRSPVKASADGTILRAGRVGAYGNLVEIRHDNGFSTRYAHLDRILVKPGDTIRRGEDIGLQGNTGRSTGSHLHYEVRYRNTPVNPKHFLKAAKHVF